METTDTQKQLECAWKGHFDVFSLQKRATVITEIELQLSVLPVADTVNNISDLRSFAYFGSLTLLKPQFL